ncbi:protein of unknown function [Nitrospira defluvii]|uniref:Uncharacterized protein n=1 Tax=Nitrospira defluvii TaxID=330214 RepID=D8P9P8_9BACT|nr:protein of unknown function [Nitrospira defluvii]
MCHPLCTHLPQASPMTTPLPVSAWLGTIKTSRYPLDHALHSRSSLQLLTLSLDTPRAPHHYLVASLEVVSIVLGEHRTQ